jgi:Polyketide cyclase / dehydrase and lipid transport
MSPSTRNVASALVLVLLASGAHAASPASVSQSVDVHATPSAVWSMIGPFCSIKDWLPPVGTCSADNKTPPTRTLVTKDGKATFIEQQIERNDSQYFYSYTFKSSPVPVKDYKSTIRVTDKGNGISTISWSGTYEPLPGHEQDALATLSGIYEAGLATIKDKLSR